MFYRVLLACLLCGAELLGGGCSVYEGIFHPRRLGTPPMTQAAKAKARAAEKARHKGTTLQASGDTEELADTGSDAPAPAGAASAAPAPEARSADDQNKAIENMLGHTYDKKTGLLKRSKLQRLQASRRQLHHYDLRAPEPTKATRAARRLRKHPKGGKKPAEPGETPEPREPAPAPDPTQPAPRPAAEAPAKPAKAPKQKAGKKDPKAPKADPTQPPPGEQ